MQQTDLLRREAARSLSRVTTIEDRIAKFGRERTGVADEMVTTLQSVVQQLDELFPATGKSAAGASIIAAAKEDLEARFSTAAPAPPCALDGVT